ncbi:MAG: hypothetical protein MJE77_30315 [Proteobacteria bacterium]|nr:hypothetical protein [Pseudomonadota bacterium]
MPVNAELLDLVVRTFRTTFSTALGQLEDPGIAPYVQTLTEADIDSDQRVLWAEVPGDMPVVRDSREYLDLIWLSVLLGMDVRKIGIQIPEKHFRGKRWKAYQPAVRSLPRNFNLAKRRQFVALLREGDTTKHGTAHDGQPLFDTSHKGADAAGNVIANQSNLYGLPFTADNWRQVRRGMRGIRLHSGELARGNQRRRYHTLLGPDNESAAETVFEARELAGGGSNPLYKASTWEIADELESDWYVFDFGVPVEGRPFNQTRTRGPKFIAKTSPQDPDVFDHGIYKFGVDGDWGLGYNRWEFCAKSQP